MDNSEEASEYEGEEVEVEGEEEEEEQEVVEKSVKIENSKRK